MRENFRLLFKTALAIGDVLSLILSFTIAYILRVKLSDKPTHLPITSVEFIYSILVFVPLWIAIFIALGLYRESIYTHKLKEIGRLFLASILGVLIIIAINYYTDEPFLPAKLVTIYALPISFISLSVLRLILHAFRHRLLLRGYGRQRAILIGNNSLLPRLVQHASGTSSGYEIVGIISDKEIIPTGFKKYYYSSLDCAMKLTKAEVLIQTDAENTEEIYDFSINNHLEYSYIPPHESLASSKSSIELIDGLPIISVRTTPLIGYGRVVKRIMDLVGGIIIGAVSAPLWIFVIIAMKVSEPSAPILFKQKRLTKHNRSFYVYKFRSHKMAYSGMDPEEAFAKMGKPELIKEYRANGDQIDNDPRVTSVGNFLRKTSLDELPQLINVIKGDISLVGPRALIARELENYPGKNLILSVKSGLTGLAQVSGRRDISFDERRRLDIYYVQNWSVWLDLQIILNTAIQVILRIGAK